MPPEGEGGAREGGREDEGDVLLIYNVHVHIDWIFIQNVVLHDQCKVHVHVHIKIYTYMYVHVCITCWPHVHCKLVVDGVKKGNPDPIHQQTLLMS